MLPLFSLLLVIALSMVVVRVATVALVLTGLSKQSARFQARSAFSGAGFTTSESEKVVGHPVRPQIIMLLMLMVSPFLCLRMLSMRPVILSWPSFRKRIFLAESFSVLRPNR